MAQGKSEPRQLIKARQGDEIIPTAEQQRGMATEETGCAGRALIQKIRIDAAATTVFDLLTKAERMMRWLAQDVSADPRPGGAFRLMDFGGLWIEGVYVDVILPEVVAFTWGGVEGLKPGQSTVKVTMHPDGIGTLVRLDQFGLSNAAVRLHDLFWKQWGLPKLKAVAESREPGMTCLSEIADWRELYSYSTPPAHDS
jgi:uncharacterized protein YndB with AHSA1/START domain